jgi:thiamine-monophosphate kinase
MAFPMKTVGEAGEFALIERIRDICGTRTAPGVTLGIGDDTAVLEVSPGMRALATCDVQVEDVHFRWDAMSPYLLGRRAAAVNLSDIASMGGTPRAALASLALPPGLPLAAFDAIFEGMRDIMSEHHGAVVGGNLARSEKLVLDIFLLGEVAPDRIVTRAGAAAGDLICVTGPLGASAAGLDVIERHGVTPSGTLARYARAHLEPQPRVREGQAIAAAGFATAMIDVSDGLAADLGHICESSGVGADLDAEAVPQPQGIEEVSLLSERAPLDYALFGGEDYELLFTARASAEDVRAWAREHRVDLWIIGRVTPDAGALRLLDAAGNAAPLGASGWDHFRAVGEEEE